MRERSAVKVINKFMKFKIFLSGVFLMISSFVISPFMAHAAIVQVSGQNKGEVGATSLANLSFANSVTTGNQVVVVVQAYKNGGAPTISAPTKNSGTAALGSFVQDATFTQNTGSQYMRVDVYRAPVTTGGTLTLKFAGTFSYSLAAINEYAGMSASPLDGSFTTSTATSNTESTGNVITSSAGMVLMASTEMSTKNFTYTQSDTNLYKSSNGASQFTGEAQQKITTTAGTYDLTAGTGNSWFWISVGVPYKSSSSDTQAPTVPTNLAVTTTTASSISLAWASSTDNVGVTGYQVFRNSVQVATTTTISFTDTGLTASTTYSYAVDAFDAAGNISVHSSSTSGTTLALPPPVINLFSATPTPITAGQSSTLAWNVSNASSLSIDNGVGNVTGVTSTIVRPASTMTYTLTAANANGTSTAQATVVVSPDTQAPTVPTNLVVNGATSSTLSLTWSPSTDDVGVTGYQISRNGTQVGTSTVTSFVDSGLTASTTYAYTVDAFDAANNVSGQSSSTLGTTQALSLPSINSFMAIPTSITAGQSSTLSWNVSNVTTLAIDNGVGVVTSATSTIVRPTSTATYTMTATNGNGTSTAQAVVTVSPDTQAPTTPTNLAATSISSSQINLSWASSTDNIGVAGYVVYRNGSQVATTTGIIFSDTGLAASTTYTYFVSAYDAANNISATSTSAFATTQSAPSGHTYTTSFPATENPISESGNWIGGQSAGGNLWGNVQTTPGLAFGVSEPTEFGDPTAILTGTWGATQSVSATVKINTTPTGSCCHEAEVRLRMTVVTSSITGYEVYCSVMPNNPYCHIARWNGPNGSYCNLDQNPPSLYLTNGDVLTGSVSGTNPVSITGFINGVQVVTATDTGQNCSPGGAAGPWTSGNPGIGFYDNPDFNWNYFGFSSLTATDNGSSSDTQAPTVPTNLAVTTTTASSISLVWASSTDNVGVTGYQVFRNGTQVGTSAGALFTDTGLTASTTYTYAVDAFDAANNISGRSSSTNGTTLASGGGGGLTWAQVQTKAQNSGGGTNALAFASATHSGNLIVVEVDWLSGSNFTSISDSQGNAYTQIGAEQNSSGVGVKSRLYYAKNIIGGGDTITTVVSGAPAYHELYIHEYSGVSTSTPLDSFSTNVGTGGTFTSNSLTTATSNELLYGIEIDSGAGAASSGWTTLSTLDGDVAADMNATTIGSYAFTGTSSGSSLVWIAAFK